jgi:hypothetical protein
MGGHTLIRVRLRFSSLEELVLQYAPRFTSRGLFLVVRSPSPVGTVARFELLLRGGALAFSGTGEVSWVQDAPDSLGFFGMVLRFITLDPGADVLLERMLAFKDGARRDSFDAREIEEDTMPDDQVDTTPFVSVRGLSRRTELDPATERLPRLGAGLRLRGQRPLGREPAPPDLSQEETALEATALQEDEGPEEDADLPTQRSARRVPFRTLPAVSRRADAPKRTTLVFRRPQNEPSELVEPDEEDNAPRSIEDVEDAISEIRTGRMFPLQVRPGPASLSASPWAETPSGVKPAGISLRAPSSPGALGLAPREAPAVTAKTLLPAKESPSVTAKTLLPAKESPSVTMKTSLPAVEEPFAPAPLLPAASEGRSAPPAPLLGLRAAPAPGVEEILRQRTRTQIDGEENARTLVPEPPGDGGRDIRDPRPTVPMLRLPPGFSEAPREDEKTNDGALAAEATLPPTDAFLRAVQEGARPREEALSTNSETAKPSTRNEAKPALSQPASVAEKAAGLPSAEEEAREKAAGLEMPTAPKLLAVSRESAALAAPAPSSPEDEVAVVAEALPEEPAAAPGPEAGEHPTKIRIVIRPIPQASGEQDAELVRLAEEVGLADLDALVEWARAEVRGVPRDAAFVERELMALAIASKVNG